MKAVNRKHAVIVGVIAVLPVITSVMVRHQYGVPVFDVPPIARNPAPLTTPDVQRILRGDFQIVRRVRQVPVAVQQAFTVLSDEAFEMVNPGQEMSTDMILPGVPDKRLIFAGLGNHTAVLVFEQGGYVGSVRAAIFDYVHTGGAWGAVLDDPRVTDIATLRTVIEKGHYTKWETMQ